MSARDANDVLLEEGEAGVRAMHDRARRFNGKRVGSPSIDPAVDEARTARPQPLEWLDMSNWDNEPVPERKWAIRDRVPAYQSGLFSGEGGTGKSIIELMKDVAHVTGRDWFGSLPEPGPAIYIGAEDHKDEIHIRLAAVAKYYGVTFKRLVEGGLHVLCLLGKESTLCASGRSGRVETTKLYDQIYEAVGDIKPRNVSIDALSHAFAGSEIDRAQVYQFANHMQALALLTNEGAVTVLSHPSMAGIASGSGTSGSTAWHGAFRFRQYLKAAKPQDSDEPDNDLRELVFKKNQYGPLGENIVLRYQRGLFLPEIGMSSLDKAARETTADRVFVDLLKRLSGQGMNFSNSPNANAYAPRLFAKEDEAKNHKLRPDELEESMRRLFAAKKILVAQYGKPANPHFRLGVVE
jgi:RecA-family ATPase